MRFYIYLLLDKTYICTTLHPRDAMQHWKGCELMRSYTILEDALTWLTGKTYSLVQITHKKKKKSEAWLAAMRVAGAKRRGRVLPEERKRRISQTKVAQGLTGPLCHWTGKKRSRQSRLKQSITMRQQAHAAPKRRCVDLSGKEHLVPGDFVLPAGWCWGRARYSYASAKPKTKLAVG